MIGLSYCNKGGLASAVKLARGFSKKITMPVSEFINDRLYAKSEGYFTKKETQLGFMDKPIPFPDIFGYEDYSKMLHERYPKNAWLTPSEIFKPYYGMTIGNYIDFIMKQMQSKGTAARGQQVKIIEVGAGNGSAAVAILNFYKLYRPSSYKNIQYTIVEISEPLIKRCKDQLSKQHPQLIANSQIRFVNSSILDYASVSNDLTFVILLEVLDNMPHERIYFKEDSEDIEMAMVEIDGDSLKEVRTKTIDIETRELFDIWREVDSMKENYEIADKGDTTVSHCLLILSLLEFTSPLEESSRRTTYFFPHTPTACSKD